VITSESRWGTPSPFGIGDAGLGNPLPMRF
jgi:hypothetical protein